MVKVPINVCVNVKIDVIMFAEESACDATVTEQINSRGENPKLAKKTASDLRGKATYTEKIIDCCLHVYRKCK